MLTTPPPAVNNIAKASIERDSGGEDIPPLMGAMFDGANDPKPGFLSLRGSSELSSSTGRSAKRRPKKEKIEIHNSNVHIYNNTDEDSNKMTLRGRPRKAYQDLSDHNSHSDRSSPRAHIRSRQIHSGQSGASSRANDSLVLKLRGGAPGSYTVEECSWDNVAAPGGNSQNDVRAGVSSWENTSALGPNAKENKDWKPNPGDWGVPSGPSLRPPWNPVTNPTEKRDVWGQIITDENGNGDIGASNWNAPFQNPAEEDVVGNANNGSFCKSGGANQQGSTWLDPRINASDQRQTGNWNVSGEDKTQQDRAGMAGALNSQQRDGGLSSNNNQKSKEDAWRAGDFHVTHNGGHWDVGRNGTKKDSSRPVRSDQVENTSGPIASAKDETLRDTRSTQLKVNTKPWMSSRNNTIKGSRSASVTSKAKSPPSSWLKSAIKKNNNGMREYLLGTSSKDIAAAIPGAWSPPLKAPKSQEPQPNHKEPKTPPSNHATPSCPVPKAPAPKSYWSSWSTSYKPLNKESPSEETFATPAYEIGDPIYTIPPAIAERTNLTHQVRPMRASPYTHRLSTPKYMDTHEDPYAVFVFKYRDKAVIERMIGEKVEETEAEEKARLAGLSKEEIIEELIRAKVANNGGRAPMSTGNQPAWTDPNGRSTNSWNGVGDVGSSSNNAASRNADSNQTIGKNWGKNPKGAGPWKHEEVVTGGNRAAIDGKGNAGIDGNYTGGNQWSNDENNFGGDWNNDDNNGGGGDLGRSGNDHEQGNGWSNDTTQEMNDNNEQANDRWDSNGYDSNGGDNWGNADNREGNDWNSDGSNDNDGGGGWGNDAQANGEAIADNGWSNSKKGHGDGGWAANGESMTGGADTTWGANSGGGGETSW